MRRLIIAILVALAIVFYLGPRPRPVVAIPLHPVDLPADLDAYLARTEATVPRLRPDLVRHIQWENAKTKAMTPLALIYLHSYSGSPKELTPVIETLGHRLHANVYFNRYRGHGQDSDAMKDARVEDWLEETSEALAIGQRLGRKVVVIALSTGATLATWLTAHHAPVAAQILISPNYAPKDWRAGLLLLPWGDRIAAAANHGKRYREWLPQNDLQRARWTFRQPVESLITMMSLVRFVDQLDFGQITAPTLVLYTTRDQTVSVEKIREGFQKLGSPHKELIEITDATGHVLTGDAFSPSTNQEVTDRMAVFLRSIAR